MKKRAILLFALILVFLLAIPVTAQENEETIYIDVQVSVYQSAAQDDLISPEKLVDGIPVADWLYQTVCAGIEGGETEIDIYKAGLQYIPEEWSNWTGESYELLSSTYKRVENGNPRWLFLSNSYGVQVEGNIFSKFVVKYRTGYEELMPAFEVAIDKAVAAISDRPTDLEKIIAAHDYLIDNCAYNWTIATWTEYDDMTLHPKGDDLIYSAYGPLVNGDAVCQGYAMAFKLLLDEMGIDSVITTSEAMNHAWNLVELDGEWYHVDVTWDDATPDCPGGGRYTYFMLSDATIADVGNNPHREWEAWYICDSTEYESGYAFNGQKNRQTSGVDLPLVNSTRPLMHYWNGEYYFIDGNVLFKGGLTGEWTEITEIRGHYYTALWIEDQLFFVEGFYGGRQFLQLKRCDLTTGEIAKVGDEYEFERTAYIRNYNGEPLTIYSSTHDLAGLRLTEDGNYIEIVSTTRRQVLATIPLVDHPMEWDSMTLEPGEQAKFAKPEFDAEDQTLELGLLLAEEHNVRNVLVSFYDGNKLVSLRMVPVASSERGLLIIDELSVAGLPAWDQVKLFAMSGDGPGFALCAGVEMLTITDE